MPIPIDYLKAAAKRIPGAERFTWFSLPPVVSKRKTLTEIIEQALSLEAAWDESLHPRADDGKFTESASDRRFNQTTNDHRLAKTAHERAAMAHRQGSPDAAAASDAALTASTDAGGQRKEAFKAFDAANAGKSEQAAQWHDKAAAFHERQIANRERIVAEKQPTAHETTVYGPGKSVQLPGRYDTTKIPKDALAVTSKNGYILVTKSPNAPEYLWVNHVRVRDAAQGKGEGSALYFAALDAAHKAGLKGILKGEIVGRGVSTGAQAVWASFERKGLTEPVTVTSKHPETGKPQTLETVALVRRPHVSLSDTISLEAQWDESLHPREPAGSEGGGQFASAGGDSVAHHERLAAEAAAAIPKLDALLPMAVKEADYTGMQPGNWDDLTPEQKQSAREDWEQNQNENGAFDEAGNQAGEDYIHDNVSPTEIFDESKDAILAKFEEKGIKVDPDTFDYTSYHGDALPKLDESILRGPDDSDISNEDMSKAVEIFDAIAQETQQTLEEKARESDGYYAAADEARNVAAIEAWDALSDGQRLEAADLREVTLVPGLPHKWMWDTDASQNEDYLRTRAIGRELTTERTDQLLKERGLTNTEKYEDGSSSETAKANGIINRVWDDWKDDSASPIGLALQLAAAKELGVVNRMTPAQETTAMAAAANLVAHREAERAASSDAIMALGMGRLQAYVRAQWETTQYILQKAGTDEIQTYRAIYLENDRLAREAKAGTGYVKLPEIQLERNAVASATTKREVANDWGGVHRAPATTRVVLRFRTPRTAAFSLPVYGKNVSGESEVVIMGQKTGFKWDAWQGEAPDFSSHALTLRMDLAEKKPIVVDLLKIDEAAGKNWLKDAWKYRTPKPKPPTAPKGKDFRTRVREALNLFNPNHDEVGRFAAGENAALYDAMLSTAKQQAGVAEGSTHDRSLDRNRLAATPHHVRVAVKETIVKDLSERLGGYGADVGNRLAGPLVIEQLDLWASTSGDHDPQAIQMQNTVAEEFNLTDAATEHLEVKAGPSKFPGEITKGKPASAEDIRRSNDITEANRRYVREEYENTQAWLKQHGITHVSVYRGMAVDAKIKTNTEANVRMQPASSWSTSKKTAVDFAILSESNAQNLAVRGMVLSASIPAERVLSTAVTGRGCLTESEVIILGGEMKVKVGN